MGGRRGDVGSLPLLYFAQGELAYESGQPADARMQFARSAQYWDDDLPEAASVEARAYLGLLDAERGQPALGRTSVAASLEHARRIGRVALEARCRLFLARIEVGAGRSNEAITLLAGVPPAVDATLGPELAAQLHYWRSVALARSRDRAAAAAEAARAQALANELAALVPAPDRAGLMSRPDIQIINEGSRD